MLIRKASLQPIRFGDLSIFDYTADAGLTSSLATIDVPPGAGHPKAWSKLSDKFYLVTAGRIEFLVNRETVRLDRGDFCFIERGNVFSYRNTSQHTASLVLVHTPAFDLSAEVFVD